MTTICCICQKTKSEKGWTSKNVSDNQRLSHGYCPECYQKTIREIEIRHIHQEMPAA